MLRLTLRTLLAYLDDTLEPAQAKQIGQKVAESEQARELIERIKQVTRRRRITTPLPGNALDPNTIADYLDNAVLPEQAAEVEQICLSSDVHLAEVAACHQVLSLILGEPASVPAESYQRMYQLVKGPEAAAPRKPVKATKGNEHPLLDGELDETLRLGLPALRRSSGWKNPLLLAGGGFAAAVLLMFVLYQIINLPNGNVNTDGHAQADTAKGKDDAKASDDGKSKDGKGADKGTEKQDSKTDPEKKNGDTPKTDGGDSDKKPADDKGLAEVKKPPTPKVELAIPEVAVAPPNPRQTPIGRFLGPEDKDNAILLQESTEKGTWKRVAVKHAKLADTVWSARPLVSLPGSKSSISTNRGAKVTLWSNAPDKWPPMQLPFRYEAAIELYVHDAFDLDLTLRRGRVILEVTESRPVYVRVRVENPQVANLYEFFDLALEGKGTEVVLDHWSYFPVTEPFFKDPENIRRVGPTAELGLLVQAGNVQVKHGDVTHTMSAHPGRSVYAWKSTEGPRGPFALPKPLQFTNQLTPQLTKARDEFSNKLNLQELDVTLAEGITSPTASVRRMAVLCMAAVDNLPGLLEALNQEPQPDLRQTAHEAVRNWISLSRENDYAFYNLLKSRFKGKEPDIIMEMLHFYSADELKRPERWELLIDNLVAQNVVIRELSHWHLANLVPQGRNIPYNASMDSNQRNVALERWRLLIPPGQLPPAAKKTAP